MIVQKNSLENCFKNKYLKVAKLTPWDMPGAKNIDRVQYVCEMNK